MRKHRFIALLLVSLMVGGMFAGCATNAPAATGQPSSAAVATQAPAQSASAPAPTAPEKVTLMYSWWGGDARHKATNAAVDFWNKNNPNIQITTSPQGWDGYNDKLLTQLAAGTAPDVFQISDNNITGFAQKGQLVDLTPFMDTVFAEYDTKLKDLYKVDGKNYALSTGLNLFCLMYNKTLLDKLGIAPPTDSETFDTLLEMSKKATKDLNGDGKIDVWGITDPVYNLDFTNQIAALYKLKIFSDDGKTSNYDNADIIAMYKMLDGFNKAGVCPKPGEVTIKEDSDEFLSGYTAFGFSALSAYGSEVGASADELDCVAFPTTKDKPEMRYICGSVPMAIYAKGQHVEQAMQFMAWFLTAADSAKAQAALTRGVFPSKAQRESIAASASGDRVMQQQIRVADFYSTLVTGGSQAPLPVNIDEWTKTYDDTYAEYAYGKLTIEQFCQKLKELGDPILAK